MDDGLKKFLTIFSIVSMVVFSVALYLSYTYVPSVNHWALALITLGLVYFGWGWFSRDGWVPLWFFFLPSFVGGGYLLHTAEFLPKWEYFPIALPITFFVMWLALIYWGIRKAKSKSNTVNASLEIPEENVRRTDEFRGSIDFPAGNGQRAMISIEDTMSNLVQANENTQEANAIRRRVADTDRRAQKHTELQALQGYVAQGLLTENAAKAAFANSMDFLDDLEFDEESSSSKKNGPRNNWPNVRNL